MKYLNKRKFSRGIKRLHAGSQQLLKDHGTETREAYMLNYRMRQATDYRLGGGSAFHWGRARRSPFPASPQAEQSPIPDDD